MRAVVVLVIVLAGTASATQPDDLAAIHTAGADCDSGRAHCIGIHLHVAGDDSGLVVDSEWVARALASAHRHFGSIDVDFKIVAIDALPPADVHIETRADRDRLAASGLPGKVIHVFVVGKLDDIDHERPFIYGVTWRKGDRKFIIVSNAARERTLAHELGHFFGLPHSTYPISIMNKTPREEPPDAVRTFADEEIPIMRATLKRLLHDGAIADR
jgi:hypothetical protein